MTMHTRPDGSRFPDRAAERAALEDFTDPSVETELDYAYHRTLGDLVTVALIGRDLARDGESLPQQWETLEHAFLQQVGLELKALNVVMATDLTTDDDGPCERVSKAEGLTLLHNLAARVAAGAELTRRLREARWGHPHFGGGEGWASKQAVDAEPESASRVRAAKVQAKPSQSQDGAS